jgi:hypothetical protein
MVRNRFKSAIITSFVLATSACTNTVPNNFQNPDKDYTFNTKELSDSYIIRKFQTWLNATPVNGAAIVKEIAYARTKYPAQFIRIMAANTVLLAAINDVQAVKDRKAIDSSFNDFLQSCEPAVFVGEFQVNTFTTDRQSFSSAAMDSDGDFVVAWGSRYQDGDSYEIYARRYNSLGVPQGSEFKVNTYTINSQNYPSVAMDSGGDFVIAWNSREQDGYGDGIFAQRFNAAGEAQGTEFQVNIYTASYQMEPSVAMDNDGDFVIAWSSGMSSFNGQDGNYVGIFARKYNSSGVPQSTTEFQVNTYTTNWQMFSAVGMDNSGDFVISWSSRYQDGDSWGVYAQRYNSDGLPAGTEFQVNTYTTGRQIFSTVALDSDGDFVIAWSDYGGQDGDSCGVFARRFNSSGVPQGSEFKVNTYTTGLQDYPSAAMDSSGNFVISWMGYGQDGDSAAYSNIYAQRYNSNAIAQGSEFKLNVYTANYQFYPAVAMDSNGDFIVSWYDSNGYDGDSYGVFARLYNNNGVAQ